MLEILKHFADESNSKKLLIIVILFLSFGIVYMLWLGREQGVLGGILVWFANYFYYNQKQ